MTIDLRSSVSNKKISSIMRYAVNFDSERKQYRAHEIASGVSDLQALCRMEIVLVGSGAARGVEALCR